MPRAVRARTRAPMRTRASCARALCVRTCAHAQHARDMPLPLGGRDLLIGQWWDWWDTRPTVGVQQGARSTTLVIDGVSARSGMAPAESGCQNGTPNDHLTQKGPKGGTPFWTPLTSGSPPGQTLKPLCCSSTGKHPYKHPLLAIVPEGLKRGTPESGCQNDTSKMTPSRKRDQKGGTPFDTLRSQF